MTAPEKNAHGVYSSTERLVLPRNKPGWRGLDTAEIKLARLDGYWIWAVSFSLMTGDCLSIASPLTDRERYRAADRESALLAASEYLRGRVERWAGRCSDARAIIEWLDALMPKQMALAL